MGALGMTRGAAPEAVIAVAEADAFGAVEDVGEVGAERGGTAADDEGEDDGAGPTDADAPTRGGERGIARGVSAGAGATVAVVDAAAATR